MLGSGPGTGYAAAVNEKGLVPSLWEPPASRGREGPQGPEESSPALLGQLTRTVLPNNWVGSVLDLHPDAHSQDAVFMPITIHRMEQREPLWREFVSFHVPFLPCLLAGSPPHSHTMPSPPIRLAGPEMS